MLAVLRKTQQFALAKSATFLLKAVAIFATTLLMEPARSIIELLGGYMSVASITGRHPTRVLRWTYPAERGGTGGLIPAKYQRLLLAHAKAAGIDLRPEHFFPGIEEGPAE
jgi:hypothetical protein